MVASIYRNPAVRLIVVALIAFAVSYAAAWSLTDAGLSFWTHPRADFTVAYVTPHIDWEWIGVGMTFGLVPASIIALFDQVRSRGQIRHSSEPAIWLALAVIIACAVGFGLFGHAYSLGHPFNPYPF